MKRRRVQQKRIDPKGGASSRPSDPFLDRLQAIRSDVGRRIDPLNAARDTAVVMRAYELPESFPKGVRAEAKRVAQLLEEPGKRLDLRDKFIFTCKGLGHMVGMSQCGANEMAKQGKNCDQILTHYFKGCTLSDNL